MNKFYGNETDTILKSSNGIFLIASQDRSFEPGDYETLRKLPDNVSPISSAIMDHEMLDSLPDELFD